MKICRLQDSSFTHADVLELIKESFQQWQENGLDSVLLRFTPAEFEENTVGAVVLVAIDTDNNALIGTTTIVPHRSNNEVGGYHKYLAVNPGYKGRGVASQLLKSCIEVAKESDYSYILSNTSVHANWSVKWHKKNGFKIIDYYASASSGYYCYRLRYQLKSPSIWNSTFCTQVASCASYLKTRAMRRQDGGMTGFGNAVLKVFRALKLV